MSKGKDNQGKVQQPSPGDGVGGDAVVPVAGGEAGTVVDGEVASSSRDIALELGAVADGDDADKQPDQSRAAAFPQLCRLQSDRREVSRLLTTSVVVATVRFQSKQAAHPQCIGRSFESHA